MISTSGRSQIFLPGLGFLRAHMRFPGFDAGGKPGANEYWLTYSPDALEADMFGGPDIERFKQNRNYSVDWSAARIVPEPICACCGQAPILWRVNRGLMLVVPHVDPTRRQYRCSRHAESNPCAVEGCKRTRRKHDAFSSESFLCARHYRMACPPGSPSRRVINRLFRLARKRGGWETLNSRYWRVWTAIVSRARSLARGDLDMTEINKLFGWDEP